MKKPILLVEDDPDIVQVLRTSIEELGYSLEHSSNGEEGLALALANEYSLVILDVNLPKLDGFTVCRQLRGKKEYLPIIMLTSKGTELDQVVGLGLGADDYVTKPFSTHALVARIKARLRISASNNTQVATEKTEAGYSEKENQLMTFGDLTIDPLRRLVKVRGQIVTLTVKEYGLLLYLAQHPGVPFNRGQLFEQIWHYTSSSYEANVNITVTRLRSKIETDPDQPLYIKTVYGLGYRFARPDEL